MPTPTQTNKPGQEPGFFVREIQISNVRASENDDRTIEIAFSSETPVERWGGYEILDHGEGSVDMARFNNGAALLADHNWRDQIGVITEARIDPKTRQGRATVKFSRSARGEEFYRDVLDGIRTGISVGYEILEAKLEEIQRDGMDVYRVTRWRPFEASIVSVPADVEGSGILGRTVGDPETPEAITALRTVETQTEETNVVHSDENKQIEDPIMGNETITPEQERQNAQTAERTRIAELLDAGERFGAQALANKYARDGGTIDDLYKEILESRGTGKVTEARSGDVEIGLTDKEVGEFRLTRLIHALANPQNRSAQEAAAFELDASAAAATKLERMGGGFSDGTAIPFEVLSSGIRAGSAITAGGADSASNVIATELLTSSFIDLLRNRLVMSQVGATTLTGLVGNLAIPRQTAGASAYWIGDEGGDAEQTDVKFDQISLTPHHLGCFTDITAQALLQSSLDIEALIRSDLATAMAIEIDRVAIYGSGSGGEPKGLTNQTGLSVIPNAAAEYPDFTNFVSMETNLALANADIGSMAYMMGPGTRGWCKTKEKFPNSNGATIWEPGNTVNGYQTAVSNQIRQATTNSGVTDKTDVFFGNWRDVLIGMWGSLNLLVDPYTGGRAGTVRVIARQWVDTNIRHPESFVQFQGTRS